MASETGRCGTAYSDANDSPSCPMVSLSPSTKRRTTRRLSMSQSVAGTTASPHANPHIIGVHVSLRTPDRRVHHVLRVPLALLHTLLCPAETQLQILGRIHPVLIPAVFLRLPQLLGADRHVVHIPHVPGLEPVRHEGPRSHRIGADEQPVLIVHPEGLTLRRALAHVTREPFDHCAPNVRRIRVLDILRMNPKISQDRHTVLVDALRIIV